MRRVGVVRVGSSFPGSFLGASSFSIRFPVLTVTCYVTNTRACLGWGYLDFLFRISGTTSPQGQSSLRHLIMLDVSYASLCVALHCRKEQNAPKMRIMGWSLRAIPYEYLDVPVTGCVPLISYGYRI